VLGADSFKLTGGDPLARPEALGALASVTDDAEVTVLTSGVAPYPELRDLIADRGWHLQISLDGPDAATHDWYRGTGAHARVTRNLDALARDGLARSVILSVCVSRVNCQRIEAILQQALAWGVGGVLLVRVSRQGHAVEHWPLLELSPSEWAGTYPRLVELHSRYLGRLRMTGFVADYVLGCLKHPATRGCRLGQSAMVDLDGRLYPCIMMGQPEHCLGDLRREALADCLAPERIAGLQANCNARLAPEGVCGACEWRMACRGACPGWPMTQRGTLQATDELCELRCQLFPRFILQLARRGRAEAGLP
jgi:radical SAM protein with 4Fe4S-binding SPASM domain